MTSFESTVRAMMKEGNLFSHGANVHIARSPGRLDLMGGNDDYTGGLVFEMTIREATWAAAQLRDDNQVVVRNTTAAQAGWEKEIACSLDLLADEETVRLFVNSTPAKRWTAYVLGNFHYLLTRYPDRVHGRGMTVYLDSEVPLNKGVSSSAAVEVAVMKGACAAYQVNLIGVDLALACQWVENVIAESACGVMDQITAVLGDEGCVLPLVCQPCNPEPLVRLPDPLQCWAVDSGVAHEVSGSEYDAARTAAFMGYKLICDSEEIPVRLDDSGAVPRFVDPQWNGYLANLPLSEFRERFERRLPERISGAEYLALGKVHVDPFTEVVADTTYAVRANTRYAVEENHRVHLFSELARAANDATERAFSLMGDIMYQSHYAYTECGLGSRATDRLVALAREEGPSRGIYGAKVTGGGAGGTVAILGRKEARDALERIVTAYAAEHGASPYVFEGSSPGADRFGVVTIAPTG